MRLRAAVGTVLVAALSMPAVGPADAAARGSACDSIRAETVSTESDLRSRPLQLLGVPRATELLRKRGITPGEGVGVAIIDSGVAPPARGRMDVVAPQSYVQGDYESSHGTTLAGLVAARPRDDGKPVGVAPGAQIVDLRVYATTDEEGSGGIPSGNVVSAVRWLADHAESEGIGVAVMAFDMGGDAPGLDAAVRDLVAADVVVVAASGNRTEGSEDGAPPGEDVAGSVFPAAYDDVLAAGATGTGFTEDASELVLLSSDIDVAVPTDGAISIGVNGRACVVEGVWTSWAAGITAGVVALMRSAYPDETAAQIRTRLVVTADGSSEARTRETGAGVLQPTEALTRVLGPAPDGSVEPLRREDLGQQRATAPVERPDPVAEMLADARWWGLFAGGALVVALVLRPLLGRRRGG